MPAYETVWGIDVGQCALKALKLRSVDGQLRVEGFDIIEHPKMLSQAEADRDQLILNALEQFLARNNLAGCRVVVAAPGQSGFTRFVKLPPVEPKQVPQIVRFEAEQQIPFDINEVIWRWQAFTDPDSPDIEVGIFAMKRTDVGDALARFAEAGITVDVVQMAPLALYNFMTFDGQVSEEGATLLVDVGADKTELVVADGPRVWTRTVQLGGNNFTAALVKAFKLSFGKAEKLKRAAATSKYAPQIFKAMQPVFAELVQEISRSIGYYTSLHRESRFVRVVGLGNGFRLPGLQTFLERNLNIPVVRLDSYNKLPPSATVNAPAFTENVLSFAVAYGLALQGLGLTRIHTSLLPEEIARQRLWARKRPWFAAAGALILAALAGVTWRAYADASALDPSASPAVREVKQLVEYYDGLRRQYREWQGKDRQEEQKIVRYWELLEYRRFWPEVQLIISESLSKVAPHQGLQNATDLDQLMKIPRAQRMVVEVDSLQAKYQARVDHITAEVLSGLGGTGRGPMGGPGYRGMPEDFGAAGDYRAPGGAVSPAARAAEARQTGLDQAAPAAEKPPQRGFILTLEGRTPLHQARNFVNRLKNQVIEQAKQPAHARWLEVTAGEVVAFSQQEAGMLPRVPGPGLPGPGRAPGAAENAQLDPLTGEDASGDAKFTIMWVFALKEAASGQVGSSGGAKGATK